MARKRIYVSGPITIGNRFTNARNLFLAADRLMSLGFAPWCPGTSCLQEMVAGEHSYQEWMAVDLAWLERADAVLLLPGESRGAEQECAHARHHGIDVFPSIPELVGQMYGRDEPIANRKDVTR